MEGVLKDKDGITAEDEICEEGNKVNVIGSRMCGTIETHREIRPY